MILSYTAVMEAYVRIKVTREEIIVNVQLLETSVKVRVRASYLALNHESREQPKDKNVLHFLFIIAHE